MRRELCARQVQRAKQPRSGVVYLRRLDRPRPVPVFVDARPARGYRRVKDRVREALVSSQEPLCANEIAGQLELHPSSVTAPLAALEAAGEAFRAGRRKSNISGVVCDTWSAQPPGRTVYRLERWS